MDYNLSIAYRIKDALYPDLQWSDKSFINFKTNLKIPIKPPDINIGSFQILNSSNVIIYWKELDNNEWNDNYIEYEIINLNSLFTKISKTSKIEMNIDENRENEFHIYSRNSLGRSNEFSKIIVPKIKNKIPYPNGLYKTKCNDNYILKWNNAKSKIIKNYTIIICDSENEQFSLCKKLIKFVTVDKLNSDNMEYIISYNTLKIFGISANTDNESSGLIWFPRNEVEKLLPFDYEIETSSDTQFIRIRLKLICNRGGLFDKFTINYNEVGSNNSGEKLIF